MEKLALFTRISIYKRCLQCSQLRGLNTVAVWQLAWHCRGNEMSRG